MVTQALIQGKDVLSVPMPSTISYSSGQHITLPLPKTGIITHIDLDVNLNYDSGDVEKEDEIKNLNDPNRPVIKRDFYFNEAMAVTLDYLSLMKKYKLAMRN